LITDDLKTFVVSQLKTAIDSGKVGMGGNSTSPAATGLDAELSATPTLTSDIEGNVFELKLTVAGSAIPGKVIREAGFFDGSELFGRESFDGVGPFSSTETLEIFFIIEVE
jgi:hypothetical protein